LNPECGAGSVGMSLTQKSKFFALAFVLLADLLMMAQTPNQLPQSPVFKSNTRLVVVDVVLTDAAGRPVHGLKKEAFTISEDGKPQTILGFDERLPDSSHASAPAPSLLKNEYTNYAVRNDSDALTVLLLDTLNSSRQDLAYARKEMVNYLKQLPRSRKVALYTLSSQLRMVQGFTDDTDSLIMAAEQLSATSHQHPMYTNNREVSATVAELKESGLAKSPKAFAAMMRFLSEDYEAKLEVRYRDTLDALTQLARSVAVIPGRKNLIWISAGFPFDSFTNGDQLQRVSALLAATRIEVCPVDVRGVLSMQPDGQTRDNEIPRNEAYESVRAREIIAAFVAA
jgi:VWFA-related protein